MNSLGAIGVATVLVFLLFVGGIPAAVFLARKATVVRRWRILWLVGALLAGALPFTLKQALENLYLSLVDYGGYVVPENSSIFTFNATEIESGSGGYWAYGEDGVNYFASGRDSQTLYLFTSRQDAKSCASFDPKREITWCNPARVRVERE